MSSYVPNFILTNIANNDPKPRAQYSMEKLYAAILFIDVSGFTALNERLAKLGPVGPEQVSKHLNKYFGSLIDVVYAHGGDVLKFAGDALICMFADYDSPPTEDLAKISLRAVQCGFEIQNTPELSQYDSSEGFKLTLHIGVGAGELYALFVGGIADSWEFLVVGEPFLQLKTAVDNSSITTSIRNTGFECFCRR